MNPLKFRHQSLGFVRSVYIIGYNELRAFLSNKGLLLSMTMQPLMYYGLWVVALSANFNNITYNNEVMPYQKYAFIGVLAVLMTTQMSQAMYRSTVDKQYGLLATKFLNGIQPYHYLAGMSVFPILGFLYQSTILYLLGIMTGITISLLEFLLSLLVAITSLLFWATLGILISSKISTYQKRDIVMTLLFTPLTFASPTFYVLSNSPIIIKSIALINPMTYQLNAIRSVAYGKADISQIGLVILLTATLMVIVQLVLNNMHLTLQER